MALTVLVGGGGGGVTVWQLGALPGQVEELLETVGGLDDKVEDLDRRFERLSDTVERFESLPESSEVRLMIQAELGGIADEMSSMKDRILVLESGE